MIFRQVFALLTISMTAAQAAAFQNGDLGDLGRGDLYHPAGRNTSDTVYSTTRLAVGDVDAAHPFHHAMLLPAFTQPQVYLAGAWAPAMQDSSPRAVDSKAVAKDAIPTLTVTGEAELQRPADQVQIRLGVVTDANEASAALEENSKRMNDVMAALEKAGLTKKECETGQFQVQPRYSHPPRQPQPDWKPTITGYQVINRINIKTQKLDKIGDLLEAATSAGANSIDSINFDLADKRKHRGEAIAEATSNAVADAKTLSAAAGQRLVRVLSMSLDNAMMQPPPMPQQFMRGGVAAAAEGMETPPINPGDITVRASVTIVYEIAPQ